MPVSRFPVSALPRTRPGACYVSGRSSESAGPYVDTGKDIPGFGAVLLSRQVVEEMHYEILKFSPPPETENEKSFREKIEEAEKRGYEKALAEIKEKFGEFSSSFFTAFGLDLSDRDDDHPDFAVPELIESTSGSDEGEPGDEPSASESDGDDSAASSGKVDRRVSGDSVNDAPAGITL